MKRSRRRGFTMVEVISAAFIAGLMLTCIYTIFFMSQGSYNTASQSYTIAQGTQTCLNWLRRDVRSSSLGTVLAYPNDNNSAEPSGLSLESPQGVQDEGKLMLNKYGAASWQKYVFYTLVPNPDGVTGRIVRWTQPVTAQEPVPASIPTLPSSRMMPSTERVVLTNVLLPNVQPNGVPSNTGANGGFSIHFVRRDTDDDALVTLNPTTQQDDENGSLPSKGNTQLIQIDLQVYAVNPQTGKPNYYAITSRMMPRN
jgi:type II secretory pathway pseudopilin PulG